MGERRLDIAISLRNERFGFWVNGKKFVSRKSRERQLLGLGHGPKEYLLHRKREDTKIRHVVYIHFFFFFSNLSFGSKLTITRQIFLEYFISNDEKYHNFIVLIHTHIAQCMRSYIYLERCLKSLM